MTEQADRIDAGITVLAEGSDNSTQAERDWESEYKQLVSRIDEVLQFSEDRVGAVLEGLLTAQQRLAAQRGMWEAGYAYGRRESLEAVTELVGHFRNLKAGTELR